MVTSAKDIDENGKSRSGFKLVEGPWQSIPYRDQE